MGLYYCMPVRVSTVESETVKDTETQVIPVRADKVLSADAYLRDTFGDKRFVAVTEGFWTMTGHKEQNKYKILPERNITALYADGKKLPIPDVEDLPGYVPPRNLGPKRIEGGSSNGLTTPSAIPEVAQLYRAQVNGKGKGKDPAWVYGYYVFLKEGNNHHWIVSGGLGRGGWFCPHVQSIDPLTLQRYDGEGGNNW